MVDDIFRVTADGELRQYASSAYESEDLLQALLAAHPDVLATGAQAGRLLLVTREMPVAESEGGQGRWSLDHLFIDIDAVPVLVEVKRASDTRLRRETVGQLLDYAAHGATYWTADELRLAFEATCAKQDVDPDVALQDHLGPDGDADGFWDDVADHLRSGRVRIVLVADAIPQPIRRVLEFLNEQMSPAEVFAVEVRQYLADGDDRTLVPRLVGNTRLAERNRATSDKAGGGSTRRSKPWTLDEIASDLARRGMGDLAPTLQRLYRELVDRADKVHLLRGKTYGSFVTATTGTEGDVHLLLARSTGQLMVPLNWLRNQPPFDDDGLRDEYRRRLEEHIDLPARLTGQPYVSLADLQEAEVFDGVLEVFDWAQGKIRESMVNSADEARPGS